MQGGVGDAGLAQGQSAYGNDTGTGTQRTGASGRKALKTVWGGDACQVPISSTKSMIGHALGASGALESVACVKTLQTGVIHPTINYEYPDPECDLDYVPNDARRQEVKTILKNSFGFGGQNACLVFRRFED